jgi:hypothetical protein
MEITETQILHLEPKVRLVRQGQLDRKDQKVIQVHKEFKALQGSPALLVQKVILGRKESKDFKDQLGQRGQPDHKDQQVQRGQPDHKDQQVLRFRAVEAVAVASL